MTVCCLVVIGHVDHGKTALVRRLTGIDTDRLAEEKARGLSIVAGYAHRTYAGGTVDFVDAPGHSDFVQAMISASSGAQAALVVISAVDGIAPQTREHLEIAALLGLTEAVIAVTKTDLLPTGALDEVLTAIRDDLAGSAFADAPMIPCSSVTGSGVQALEGAIEVLLRRVQAGRGPAFPYLPVDRAFTLPGRGTIVTGTLLGRALRVGADMLLQPGALPVTIRGLHSRDAAQETIIAGGRTAANLRGVAVEDVPRGAVLCGAAAGDASTCIDVHLTLLAAAGLKHMQEVRVHIGTAHVVAQIRLFGAGRLAAGENGLAQLRFRHPVMAHAGQRAILRRLSPPSTLGGAVVLDPQAPPSRAGDKARVRVLRAAVAQDLAEVALALIAANGGAVPLQDAARLARRDLATLRAAPGPEVIEIAADRVTSAEAIADCRAALLQVIRDHHRRYPARSAVPLSALCPRDTAPDLLHHVRQALIEDGTCRQSERGMALARHDPMTALPRAHLERLAQIEAAVRDGGLAPPALSQVLGGPQDQDLLGLLIDQGALIALPNIALKQTVVLHRETLRTAAGALRAAFPPPAAFTTGEARAALDTSRRIIVPLLEHFDALGVTTRGGDRRRMSDVPGGLRDPGHGAG
ncbi:hypothetical protein A8B82_10390 [Sulfitobacter sp. EhC04]|uniref:selenocysteine-specific translation elongation factor n=1 Tax=Sulfitobacter sp. EhC04 TaxID=1849168 RepID=UPI0007F487DB|nr:selenocysteine-specific translation elongation factor [Sulfitobacter sp. EhC04]OAN78153.1 hypothetical protein A8B82_10390 [Sulfitobacter sp. EhC04]